MIFLYTHLGYITRKRELMHETNVQLFGSTNVQQNLKGVCQHLESIQFREAKIIGILKAN